MAKVVIADTNLGDGSIEREVLTPQFELEVADVKTEDEVVAAAAGAEGLLVQWAPITDRVILAPAPMSAPSKTTEPSTTAAAATRTSRPSVDPPMTAESAAR